VDPGAAIPDTFVRVIDGHFSLGGQAYTFAGTNFWQGMNLGVDGPDGNRDLLLEELDQLQILGITNLRVMAASEGPDTEPYRMVPSLQTAPGVYDPAVLDGLDFLLAEIARRDMKAVMVLNNYWYWSGGMAQYVAWDDGTRIPYPGDWGTYMAYAARFYFCEPCQDWYRAHIAMLVEHVNPYTGLAYKDDPSIFSWELANEPRRYPLPWIDATAAYIKSLDPNHMVTTGSEGTPPGERIDFVDTHDGPDIDYLTIHIWPQNWGWYDPARPSTYEEAEVQAILYFQNHARDAASIDKPLVLEEFGLARDGGAGRNIFAPNTSTSYRDRFYTVLFEQVHSNLSEGGAAAGDNFWAWAGSARPGYPWIGDPPHETAGWYSVYDSDESTLEIIASHAAQMTAGR
jgi:mannan endo-1,4-beta-mannosidase